MFNYFILNNSNNSNTNNSNNNNNNKNNNNNNNINNNSKHILNNNTAINDRQYLRKRIMERQISLDIACDYVMTQTTSQFINKYLVRESLSALFLFILFIY